MCEGVIKTNPRPQEFYRAGTAPPGFEVPGSATVLLLKVYYKYCSMIINGNSTVLNLTFNLPFIA